MTAIAILGEYTPASAPQAATTVAIGHAQAWLGGGADAEGEARVIELPAIRSFSAPSSSPARK
jgi:ribosomal protein S16